MRATLDLWGALLILEMGALETSDANVQVSRFHHGDWTRKQKFAGGPKDGLLSLFSKTAEDDARREEAREVAMLSAGHAVRVNTALAHMGREVGFCDSRPW